MSLRARQRSSDGKTEKLLVALHDGQAIEVVLMTYDRRRTACISTQVGCAMGCTFCATGQMGFRRQLSAGEIVEQVILLARLLAGQGSREHASFEAIVQRFLAAEAVVRVGVQPMEHAADEIHDVTGDSHDRLGAIPRGRPPRLGCGHDGGTVGEYAGQALSKLVV